MTTRERLILVALLLVLVGANLAFYLISPHDFALFFRWPSGGVWSNMVASAILGVPAVYAILRKMAQHHREHLAVLHRHHRELMERQSG